MSLPHVEDEDLRTLCQRTRLEYETARLGDAHEIADNILVRHRHRPSGGDLTAEESDHGAVTAQDVAKSGGDKDGLALYPAF